MPASLTRRLSTTAAAALLAVLVPAAPVARAQPSSQPPAEAEHSGPTPPPGEGRGKPPNDGRPDWPYTQKTDGGCVGTESSSAELTKIPWGQKTLRFDELHRFATGEGKTVAVIDTGVRSHPFLGARLSGGGDYVQQGKDGLDDCDGHGTQVAGVIAAFPGDDDIGFRGIAYNAKILSIRQSSDRFEYRPPNREAEPVDKAGSLSTLAKAVVNAADRGVDVINMSVDTCRLAEEHPENSPITDPERELQRALRYAFEERDVVLVASAGNIPSGRCAEQNSADPAHPRYIVSPPWFSEYVLSVAAMRPDGSVADFSMHGPWVSVAAPGTDITSLDMASGLADETISATGERSRIQGTSFAAPYVAGLAALILERYEKLGKPLTAKQVMERIKATAVHPATAGGHDSEVGYGMINPVSALTTMIPGEEGITRDQAVDVPFEVPPAHERDWSPERVAVAGSAGGLGLLLLTLFIVHTVRRQRRDRNGSA